MSRFDSRFERLELKYLVSEGVAEEIRRDIQATCRPDPHNPAARSPRRGYPVSSLYLDSPSLAFHRAKERGDAERLKLRIRAYGDSPVTVLECKRRVADVIDKRRARVHRKDVENAAHGALDPGPDEREASVFLQHFAGLVARSGAQPKLLVRYEREAWVSDVDHYARVTFDRRIEAQRTASWTLDECVGDRVRFEDHWAREESHRSVVLELKCQSCIPWWMTDLIRKHSLERQSFSKYSIGIHLTGVAAGEDLLGRRSARWMQ